MIDFNTSETVSVSNSGLIDLGYALGSDRTSETSQAVPADKRSFVLNGVPADEEYTIEVRAYRSVDADVADGGLIKSGPGEVPANPFIPSRTVQLGGSVQIGGTPIGAIVDASKDFTGRVVPITELLGRQDNLEINFGTTVSAQASADAAAAYAQTSTLAASNAAQALNDAKSARDAAQAALTLALGAASTSVDAKAAAQAARDAAQLALSNSQSVFAQADAARVIAISARDNAELARDASQAARDASQAARDAATSAQADAQNQAAAALASQGAAAVSATKASGSKSEASDSASAASASMVAAQAARDLASGSANSASISAAGAAASSDTAGQKASAANTSAVNAATSASDAGTAKGQAQTFAGNASASASASAGSASDALGSKNAAANSASLAAGSASTAGGSATAANTSAGTANTAATNAGNSAIAAQASNVAANSTAAGMFPDHLDGTALAWTSTRTGQAPTPFAATSYTNVAGYGKALTFSTTDAAQFGVNHLVAVPFVQGRFYRLEIEYALTSASSGTVPSAQFVITPMDGNYALLSSGQIFGATTVVGSDPVTRVVTLGCGVTGGDVNISATATWIRTEFKFFNNSGTTGVVSWQVRRYKVTDVTSQTLAAQSASAAAGSVSTASTKASEAGQSASAANTSATNANTSAGNASTSASNASTSESNALGSKNAAAGSASLAAGSATAAGNSAVAANTSAGNALTSATNSGNSAIAANTSAVNAASTYTSVVTAQNTVADLPYDFANGFQNWTIGRVGGPLAPIVSVGGTAGSAIVTNDPDFGPAYEGTWANAGTNLMTRGALPTTAGRTHEVRIRFKITTLPTDGAVNINVIAAFMLGDYTASTVPTAYIASLNNLTAVNTVYEIVGYCSSTASTGVTAWPTDAKFVRYGLRLNSTETGMTIRVGSIRVTDVTDTLSSKANADAAAGSASVANTKASEAGSSASAANTSAVNASSSYTAANQSVALSFPADFSQSSKFWTNVSTGQFPPDTTVGSYVAAGGTGTVYEVTGQNALLNPKGYFKPVGGRRYRVSAVVRTTVDPASPAMFGVDFADGLGQMFNIAASLSGVYEIPAGGQSHIAVPASAGWQAITIDFTSSATPTPYLRPRLFSYATNPAGGTWQVRSMTLTDVTDSAAANVAANAASVSASTASTKADAAGQSAEAANSSATIASTRAGDAQTYAGNAATSASNALGSQQTASQVSGVAVQAKTDAETAKGLAAGSASAAATSASNAGSKADLAGQSATAAVTSATNAGTSASNAGTSERNAATSAQNASGSASTATTQAGVAARSALDSSGAAIDGNKVPGSSTSTWSINEYNVIKPVGRLPAVDTGGISYVAGQLRINGGGHIHPVVATRLIAGRRYLASVTFRLITNGTQENGHNLFVDFFDVNGTSVADSNVAVLATTTVAAGFKTLTATVSSNSAGGSIGWPSNAMFGRVMFRTANGVTTEITSLFLEDVEAQLASQEAATASAGSASTASTKASEAGQSASAAQGSATIAGTRAGEASTSASNASTSESNALGSKNAAASSASVAATAKDDAVTAKGLAQGSATAAATSASQASTSKDTAGQSASAAAQQATNAQTHSGNAQTYRDQASTSASNALGSQQTATTQAGLAAQSKTDAGLSASAAAGSASTAQTKASEAGTSASAAAASSLSALGYANAAGSAATGNLVRQGSFEALSNVDWRGQSLATVEPASGIPSGRTSLLRLQFRDVWQTAVINGAWRGRKIKVTIEAWNGSSFPLNVGLQLLRTNNTADYALYQVLPANSSGWQTKTIEFTIADVDYVWIRPILQIANDAGGGTLNAAVSYIRMEDVTTVKAAEASAVLAANSASTATTKADAATTSASTATTAATNAATYRDQSNTYAGQALTSANNASSSAASASASNVIASSYSSSAFNKNDKFANWPGSASDYPLFWGAWATGGNYRIDRQTGVGSPYALRTLCDNPNVDGGFFQNVPIHNGRWVMEVTARLDGNNWIGAGCSFAGRWSINFAQMADSNGLIATDGVGQTRTWSIMFTINGEVSGDQPLYGMHAWAGFGSRDPRYMTWFNLRVRPATQNEINANKALTDSAANSSAISTLQSTSASQGSSLATVINTVAAQATGGGNVLSNTTFPTGANGTVGWNFGWNLVTPPPSYGVNVAGDPWHPEGENALSVMHAGRSNGGFSDWNSNRFPVAGGSYIQFSVLVASHRTDTQLYVFWFNSDGVNVGNTGDYLSTNAFTRKTGGNDINNWTRLGLASYQVPTGAVSACMTLRTFDTEAGANPANSYSWFLRPYFGAAKLGQTEWNPYSPGSGSIVQTALQASVTTQASAIADANGKLQAYLVSDVSAGNGRAILSLRANGISNSSNIDLAASQIRLINSAGGVLAPTLSVQDGNVSISGDLYMGTGRIVSKNGNYMKVQGSGFGSNNQFLEWYGPVKSTLDQCTESIAITYLRTDGQAYFGGRVAEGDLRTVKTTYDGGLSQVANGPIVTNGKTRVWTAGLSVRRTGTRTSAYGQTGSWTGTFVIEKLVNNNWVQQGSAGSLTGYTYESGNNGLAGEFEPAIFEQNASGSQSFSDTSGGIDPYNIRARITSINLPGVTGNAPKADYTVQMLTINTYEV